MGRSNTYTVLGCVVLGLQGTEEGLLSTENLDSRTRRLGEVHKGSSMGNEARTNELANKSCQVRSEGLHAVGQVARFQAAPTEAHVVAIKRIF